MASDIKALMPKGGSEPELTFEIYDDLCAPVEKGTLAGKAVYTLDGETIAEADIVTSEGVERSSLLTVIERLMGSWCS